VEFLCILINKPKGMMQTNKKSFGKRTIPIIFSIALLFVGPLAFAQKDSTLFFRSAVSVTQNGFSFIPSFSLGKPAAILDIGVGNKRLSFEPQFRFALEGKPWSFIFIYRYKVVNKSKFQFTVGGHIPAIVFKTQTISTSSGVNDVIISQRFIAGELIPNYQVAKNISISLYLLQGYGFQSHATRYTSFAGLRSNFSNVKLSERLYIKWVPQIFYLKTDDQDGVYVTYHFTFAMKNFPLSISHILNKSIQTSIVAKDFDWNVSLIYSFDKNYVRR